MLPHLTLVGFPGPEDNMELVARLIQRGQSCGSGTTFQFTMNDPG